MHTKIAALLVMGLGGALLGAGCNDQACLLKSGCVGECTDVCLDPWLETDAVFFGAATLVYIGPETGAPTCESLGMAERFHAWSDPLEDPACPLCVCHGVGWDVNTVHQLNRDRACRDPTASDDTWSGWDVIFPDCARHDSATLPPTGSVTLLDTFIDYECWESRDGKSFLPDKTWKTFARVCDARRLEYTCTYDPPNAPQVCTRKPPSPDFHLCVFPGHEDEHEYDEDAATIVCPERYPEKHIFYERSATNPEGCGDCICQKIEALTYSHTVSLYVDGACTELVQSTALQSSVLTEPACVPLASPERIGGVVIETLPLAPEDLCEIVGEKPPRRTPPVKITPREPRLACCRPSDG
jgi:hypothetical protein